MCKPNILLITSDQQHWNTIGSYNAEISTPNLDRLAKEGTTFTRAYAPNPTCTPTRASIITGMYPSQHGAYSLGTKLPEDVLTVGERLAQSGYRTALIGKAHFQPTKSTEQFPSIESFPQLQNLDAWRHFNEPYYGFERVELCRNHTTESSVGQHYAIWMEDNGLANWRDYFGGDWRRNKQHKWSLPEEFHYDAWIAERTNALLEQFKEKEESFFLWASFPDPHPKYIVPEPWDTMYDPETLMVPQLVNGEHANNPPHHQLTQQEKADFSAYAESGFYLHGLSSHAHSVQSLKKDIATYYGMISMMDKYIGKILDKLDELGMADNTLVVFTSDHGNFMGQHGLIKKGPFHYEDLIRIPMIVRYPQQVPHHATTATLQSLVDLAPTFLSFAGLTVPRKMTGVDQSAVWRGEARQARDHIICENHQEPTTIHLKTYVNERYKLTVYFNQVYGELFDLEEDPRELNNLWNDPEKSSLKSELLLKYVWAELGKEPMWMPRVSGA